MKTVMYYKTFGISPAAYENHATQPLWLWNRQQARASRIVKLFGSRISRSAICSRWKSLFFNDSTHYVLVKHWSYFVTYLLQPITVPECETLSKHSTDDITRARTYTSHIVYCLLAPCNFSCPYTWRHVPQDGWRPLFNDLRTLPSLSLSTDLQISTS